MTGAASGHDGADGAVPAHADVVVVGGGIVGCATAYFMARHGCADVVLIERETLTCGTTWHAAGIVGSLRASVALTRLTLEACRLFPELEAETGQATGYRRTGGLSIATTEARLRELERIPPIGALTGVAAEMISAAEIARRCPLLNADDLTGGVWFPHDGQTNPTDTTLALASGARLRGAHLFEHVCLRELEVHNGAVRAVLTDRGRIACSAVVLCTGMWTRHLARRHGVAVPLQAVEHMYIVTEPMAGVPRDQPLIRDLDAHLYIKGDAGRLLVGAIDPVAKPWAVSAIPEPCAFTLLPEDWDHFEPFMHAALHRVPALADAGVRQFLNGPESFTVDSRHIMGEAPGLRRLFIAAGFNTTGIMSSAGVGKAMAEWVMHGGPPMDLWEVDIQRFEGWTATERFIRERTRESVGLAFAMHWPYRQHESARGVKRSALHSRLEARGACFGVLAGWERPLWYAPEGAPARPEYSFGAQHWWPYAAAEARATRERVALYEQSQMAVFELTGADAERVLGFLCANDVAVTPGQVVYTQMLNEHGGIECDLTVSRLGHDRYLITTGAALRVHDYHWIKSHIPRGAAAGLIDLSSSFSTLGLMGPASRALLQTLSRDDIGPGTFPFATIRTLEIGMATVLVQRLSYVGELGFELYVPTECLVNVYDSLVGAGAAFGLAHAGLQCMDCCRLEKGFRHWGHDLSPSLSPFEAGLDFAVRLDKPFLGRDALLRQKREGLTRRLVLFHIAAGEPLALHEEPVYRDGELSGATTSGNRALTHGGTLCFGLIEHAPGCTRAFVESGRYEIVIGRERYPATALARAPYDPRGLRMRA